MTFAEAAPIRAGPVIDVEPSESGLTLVEILIVLSIIAIAASVLVLSIGSDAGMRGLAEARRMAGRVQLASDRTMIGAGTMGILVAPDRYSFVEFDSDDLAWRASDDPGLTESIELPDGLKLEVAAEGATVLPLGADGFGQPFTLALVGNERSWIISYDGMTARAQPAEAAVASTR